MQTRIVPSSELKDSLAPADYMEAPGGIGIGSYYQFNYPYYGTPDSHPDHSAHRGQVVQVVRQLTDKECDPECGPNFIVRALSDGWQGNAHQSELSLVRVRKWDNYLILDRISTGTAARQNRGRHAGSKIHKIQVEEVVGIVDEAAELAKSSRTVGKDFLKTRKPTYFSASPLCGCCQGQHAAKEVKGQLVTCTKCGG